MRHIKLRVRNLIRRMKHKNATSFSSAKYVDIAALSPRSSMRMPISCIDLRPEASHAKSAHATGPRNGNAESQTSFRTVAVILTESPTSTL